MTAYVINQIIAVGEILKSLLVFIEDLNYCCDPTE